MIPHNMTLFKFICVQYQFHGQTLPIMKFNFESMFQQERNLQVTYWTLTGKILYTARCGR